MEIPSKLKIGALTFKVIQHPIADCGRSNISEQVIEINSELSAELKLVTFWHEVFHCANNELDEKEVEWIGGVVAQVILDNGLHKK